MLCLIDYNDSHAAELRTSSLGSHLETNQLIEILPSHDHETTRCRMSAADLVEDRHVALSYVWGTDELSHKIESDGRSFFVRSNLSSFLQQASRQHTEKMLWIDAICINQTNIAERNHQVRQMLKIYQQARFVLIWLGPVPHNPHLSEVFRRAKDTEQSTFMSWQYRYGREMALLFKLGALCELDYWKRLWIVPEVLAARMLYVSLGDEVISWLNLTSLVEDAPEASDARLLPIQQTIARNSFVPLAKQKGLRPPEETSYTFHRLLFTYGMNLCSDPRDRVIALLALAQDVDTAQIRYEMTTQDLYFQILLQVAPDSGQMTELAEYLLPVLALNVLTMGLELPDYTARARNVVFACLGTARGKHNSSDVWIAS